MGYMLFLKIFMSGMIFLQLSGIIKSIVKSSGRLSKSVITSSGKIIKQGKSLNKASAMLLADDGTILRSSIVSDEKVLAGQADDFATMPKGVSEEGSFIEKGAKSGEKLEKKLKKTTKDKFDEAMDVLEMEVNDKLENAMEELIYENLDRTGSLFENSVHELLNEPKFDVVSSYFKEKYDYTLRQRLDIFLLLNERDVDGFKIGRREVSQILALYSDVFAGRALAFLLVDLSEYTRVTDAIKMYASKRKILMTGMSNEP
jgi:hypothetical protein